MACEWPVSLSPGTHGVTYSKLLGEFRETLDNDSPKEPGLTEEPSPWNERTYTGTQGGACQGED